MIALSIITTLKDNFSIGLSEGERENLAREIELILSDYHIVHDSMYEGR